MRACLISSMLGAIAVSAVACGDAVGNPITAGPGGDDKVGEDGGGPIARDDQDASIGGDAGNDAGSPKVDTGLAVASASGVHYWKNATPISADVAPDFTLATGGALSNGVTTVAAGHGRLWAGRASTNDGPAASHALLRFDVASLQASSTPSATITTTKATSSLAVDADDRLWAIENLGKVLMFTGASALPAAGATPTATFTHAFEQLTSVVREPTSDRLFGGQISGAGTLGWNQASNRTGTSMSDFVISSGDHAYWALQLAGNRLYAAGKHSSTSGGVAIWPSASTATAEIPPILLTSGYDPTKFISHMVLRNDVLAVAARDQDTIFVYKNASTITADKPADFTITHASLHLPKRIALDANDRLYVVDDDGVVVFANTGSAPAFVAELKTGLGRPADLALVE
jgi:hypothetical protein